MNQKNKLLDEWKMEFPGVTTRRMAHINSLEGDGWIHAGWMDEFCSFSAKRAIRINIRKSNKQVRDYVRHERTTWRGWLETFIYKTPFWDFYCRHFGFVNVCVYNEKN